MIQLWGALDLGLITICWPRDRVESSRRINFIMYIILYKFHDTYMYIIQIIYFKSRLQQVQCWNPECICKYKYINQLCDIILIFLHWNVIGRLLSIHLQCHKWNNRKMQLQFQQFAKANALYCILFPHTEQIAIIECGVPLKLKVNK